jgi:phosphoribosylformimino-5-aminoimidazole carboxamide ribotide isomerase
VIAAVSFRVIPVMDLKGGKVVHAVGGRRDQYQPLRSIWQASGSPAALAVAIREGLGLESLYVADLDAIEGRPPNSELYDGLEADGLEVWLDAGVGDVEMLEPFLGLVSRGVRIVVGLESLKRPQSVGDIIRLIGRDRVILSLDMDDARPRTAPGAAWRGMDAPAIAAEAVGLGIRHLILLDLTRVGTNRGVRTAEIMMRLRKRHPDVAITVGGGIRGVDDVLGMRELGASAVLVGSAIHDGRIGRPELMRIAAAS